VAFVDELQARGYVTRDRNDTDRRLYALHLTEQGRDLMTQLGDVAREHDRQITAGNERIPASTHADWPSAVVTSTCRVRNPCDTAESGHPRLGGGTP
jgi:hypothetical protein